ncbi:MAG: HAMP domain-containing histidine kinase [Acidobacteria bacterium]|nr:HAMP domain-containing histidine kinase [Acidobacteriota bacterium]MCI0720879.1 HAMP domain-containing histidine kinase [Acidobacteriota bacterium]
MRISRTVAAFLMTSAAVAGPCSAWYVVGSREVARETIRLEREPQQQARETADRHARRLAARLESLRQAESRRPFYHYQNLYHDPKGAYEGASVIPSPLAQGPADPLIQAHFQVDAAGRLTLPTFNPEVPNLNPREGLAAQQALLDQLTPAAPEYLRALGIEPNPRHTLGSRVTPVLQAKGEVPSAQTQFGQSLRSPTHLQAGREPAKGGEAASPQSADPGLPNQPLKFSRTPQQVELLDPAAFAQNVQANQLYANLKQAAASNRLSPQLPRPETPIKQKEIVIGVGPLLWHTLPVGNVASLVALREVTRPDGVMAQGFAISRSALAEELKGTPFPAHLLPNLPAQAKESMVTSAIEGTSWHLAVDVAAALPAAGAQALQVKRGFLRYFAAGTVFALLAGLLVVGLVWQSEQLARQRSQFAAAAAHELRTPLAGLRMYGEMIAEGLGDPNRGRAYARRIAEESERLGRVVGNVLSFTRLERASHSVRPERGNLGAAVHHCVARLEPALESLGARVELIVAEGLPAAHFDPDALDRIVQNLLDNAEKYSRQAADRTIHVSLKHTLARVSLSVADHGPGISPADRKRLFRPFVRGKQADPPAGLGLGLALVERLARAQGGDAAYSPAPGGGAVFTVTFPTQ